MRLTYKDVDKAIALLQRGANKWDWLPEIHEGKLREYMMAHIENPKTYMGVNKDITAIIVLQVVPDVFSTRQSIKDLVWYSETRGCGVRVLKESRKWVEDWGDSVYEAYLSTSMNDERTDEMIGRMGFKKIGSQYSFRGGEV